MSALVRPPLRVIWAPLAGSQSLAAACPCNHILYEGTRGPGKTDLQLMFFRKYVRRGYGAFWRGVIFDREYKNLDDLVAKSRKWFPQFGDGAQFLESKGDYKWKWRTGEELLFRVVKKDSDYDAYHGHEYPFIGWNELTKQATSHLYDDLMSCNRSSFLPEEHSPKDRQGNITRMLPPIPLVVVSTTNPHGRGHNWVKSRFVDVAEPGQVVRKTVEVFNPRTQQRELVTKTQVRIFGSYKENRYLDPMYIAELEGIKDPNKRRAWLYGDWDIASGGALDDVWTDKAKIPRFRIPSGWYLDRTLDWGSSQPCSVGFWAEANGEEAHLPNGRVFCPPAGSLVRIKDLYLCTEIGQNRGLKKSPRFVAQEVLRVTQELQENKWINGRVFPGPADNSIGDVTDSESDTIRQKMASEGVEWTASNKRQGSRKLGLEALRGRLEATATGEGPGIYWMDNCRASLTLLKNIPRDEDDPDDVDTDSEDHLYDETRYRVLAGSNRQASSIDVEYPT